MVYEKIASEHLKKHTVVVYTIQGSPHIPTGFCRRFTAFICMIQKIVINIFWGPVSWLSTIQIWASYHDNCSNATTISKLIEICLARGSYLALIFELVITFIWNSRGIILRYSLKKILMMFFAETNISGCAVIQREKAW